MRNVAQVASDRQTRHTPGEWPTSSPPSSSASWSEACTRPPQPPACAARAGAPAGRGGGPPPRLRAASLSPTNIFTVGGVRFPAPHLITLGPVVALSLGLISFLRFSPLGVRMRAVVDQP